MLGVRHFIWINILQGQKIHCFMNEKFFIQISFKYCSFMLNEGAIANKFGSSINWFDLKAFERASVFFETIWVVNKIDVV